MRNEKGQFIKGSNGGWLGRKHKLQSLINISESHKGLKQSPETIEKRVSKLRGRKRPGSYSLEARMKISTARKGKRSNNWKGENCKKKDQRNDPAYQYLVRKVKERDGWKCKMKNENCKGYCVVHHILPWRDYPELRYEKNNCITLCQFHHPRKRAHEAKLIPFFTQIIKENIYE